MHLAIATPGSGAVGRGLQPEDAVVVFARSCGYVCNKQPLQTSSPADSSSFTARADYFLSICNSLPPDAQLTGHCWQLDLRQLFLTIPPRSGSRNVRLPMSCRRG